MLVCAQIRSFAPTGHNTPRPALKFHLHKLCRGAPQLPKPWGKHLPKVSQTRPRRSDLKYHHFATTKVVFAVQKASPKGSFSPAFVSCDYEGTGRKRLKKLRICLTNHHSAHKNQHATTEFATLPRVRLVALMDCQMQTRGSTRVQLRLMSLLCPQMFKVSSQPVVIVSESA